MPEVTGIGTTWNLPNYAGELFTADPTQTPLLSMVGGLTEDNPVATTFVGRPMTSVIKSFIICT